MNIISRYTVKCNFLKRTLAQSGSTLYKIMTFSTSNHELVNDEKVVNAFNTSNQSTTLDSSSKFAVVKHPFPINGVPLTDSKADDRFAIIEFSGTQFKVTIDDVMVADKIEGIDIGQILEAEKVLLVGSRSATLVGSPTVPGATVRLQVEEITKDKKVIIFKSRRRKNSRSKNGFRREVTILRIKDILLEGEHGNML